MHLRQACHLLINTGFSRVPLMQLTARTAEFLLAVATALKHGVNENRPNARSKIAW